VLGGGVEHKDHLISVYRVFTEKHVRKLNVVFIDKHKSNRKLFRGLLQVIKVVNDQGLEVKLKAVVEDLMQWAYDIFVLIAHDDDVPVFLLSCQVYNLIELLESFLNILPRTDLIYFFMYTLGHNN